VFDHADRELLIRIEAKADQIMAAQDDINNAVSVLGPFLTDLSSQVQAIAAALAAGTGTPVDTGALNALIEQVPAAQAAVDALTTPAAAPPPSPAPAS
jgi:hypothetical protein